MRSRAPSPGTLVIKPDAEVPSGSMRSAWTGTSPTTATRGADRCTKPEPLISTLMTHGAEFASGGTASKVAESTVMSFLLGQLEVVEEHVAREIRRGEDLQDAHPLEVDPLEFTQRNAHRRHGEDRRGNHLECCASARERYLLNQVVRHRSGHRRAEARLIKFRRSAVQVSQLHFEGWERTVFDRVLVGQIEVRGHPHHEPLEWRPVLVGREEGELDDVGGGRCEVWL